MLKHAFSISVAELHSFCLSIAYIVHPCHSYIESLPILIRNHTKFTKMITLQIAGCCSLQLILAHLLKYTVFL